MLQTYKEKEELQKKIHPIFLEDVPQTEFMDERHFLRYWHIKKAFLEGRLYPCGYKEITDHKGRLYIDQMWDLPEWRPPSPLGFVIIGRDDTTKKLFVEIRSREEARFDSGEREGEYDLHVEKHNFETVRHILGYDFEFDEYLIALNKFGLDPELEALRRADYKVRKEIFGWDPLIPDRAVYVRVQGDLKMYVEPINEDRAIRFLLRQYFDDFAWYLYREKKALDLLEKYIEFFMPPALDSLVRVIPEDLMTNYDAFTVRLMMLQRELSENYPDVLRDFVSKYNGDWTLYLGRPSNPHIVKISNGIRLGQSQFIVTKMTKIHISHAEHGELDVPVPNIARVMFFT